MASNTKTYFKFAICLVLLVSLECRVIKIVDEDEDAKDIIVKIIIKHSKSNSHKKINNDHQVAASEKNEVNNIVNKAIEGFSSSTDADKNQDNATSILNKDDTFTLPDNLFEDLEDMPNMQSSSEEEPKQKPDLEPIPSFSSRSGIQVGNCPAGFIRNGGLCLPANN